MRHGQRNFGARNAAADDDTGRARRRPLQERLPGACERPQRLYRVGVYVKAREARKIGRNADIQRGNIVADRRASLEMHQLVFPVDAGGLVEDDPCTCKPGKAHEVDIQLIARVMPGHVAWQHAGIRAGRTGIDQRDPGARQRGHPPHPQRERMRMPAADQDEVPGERPFDVHA